jgi:hypothetical protein
MDSSKGGTDPLRLRQNRKCNWCNWLLLSAEDPVSRGGTARQLI